MTRHQVFDAIRSRGAVKAVVRFSGGNDEGYCDSVKLVNSNGVEVATLHEYDYEGNLSQADQDLAAAICAPVYDRYGSFAGEFEVSGTVTWDATDATVKMGEEYGEMTYQHHEYDY